MGVTLLLLGLATYTDLRWRRIPNTLTFPALAIGLLMHSFESRAGLVFSVSGALVAPAMLFLAHRGKGLGMGDIKMAAAIGGLLCLPLGTVAILLSMIAGGVLALVWMLKEWGVFGHGGSVSALRKLLPSRRGVDNDELNTATGSALADPSRMAIPYGLAMVVGTLAALGVSLWTGTERWFPWVGNAS
jgi:prepilin peptidase CpaA